MLFSLNLIIIRIGNSLAIGRIVVENGELSCGGIWEAILHLAITVLSATYNVLFLMENQVTCQHTSGLLS